MLHATGGISAVDTGQFSLSGIATVVDAVHLVLGLDVMDASWQLVKLAIKGGATTEVAYSVSYGCDMRELSKMTTPFLKEFSKLLAAREEPLRSNLKANFVKIEPALETNLIIRQKKVLEMFGKASSVGISCFMGSPTPGTCLPAPTNPKKAFVLFQYYQTLCCGRPNPPSCIIIKNPRLFSGSSPPRHVERARCCPPTTILTFLAFPILIVAPGVLSDFQTLNQNAPKLKPREFDFGVGALGCPRPAPIWVVVARVRSAYRNWDPTGYHK